MRYDETKVEDYFLQLDQTHTQSTVLTQAYPASGREPNPDRRSAGARHRHRDRRHADDGCARRRSPSADEVVGHYMRGPPSGRRRAPRSWSAARTGSRSTIDLGGMFAPRIGQHAAVGCARERGRASWAERLEAPRFLADGKRFIWTSERADFRNFYLYDLSAENSWRG
jgi:hypothetical protein